MSSGGLSGKEGRGEGSLLRGLAAGLLCLGLCGLGGCFDGDEPSSERSANATAAKEAPAPAPAQPVRVYALSDPLPPASPEEAAKAQAVVDYVNRVGRELTGLCGRYPALIMLGVEEYRNTYGTLDFGTDAPSATCAARGLSPKKGVLGEEDEKKAEEALTAMDRLRGSMRADYEALRRYVANPDIVDDGRKGRALVASIEKSWKAYGAAMEDLHTLLDARAGEAQATLLRGHPLRDHVLLAGEVVGIFRRQADRLALGDPDPGSLDAPLKTLEEDITRGERLPFPVAGEPEMHYRTFLKDARAMTEILKRGQLESFHRKVRDELNARWVECRAHYNAFVDALARR